LTDYGFPGEARLNSPFFNPVAIVDRPGDSPPPQLSAVERFTWHTVALCVVCIGFVLLTRHPVQTQIRPFSARAMFIAAFIEWTLCFVAYRGILASGLTFSEVLGQPWSTLADFRKDFKNALLVVFVILASTALFVRLEPFVSGHRGRAKTGLEYLVTLLVAVTAGYTEEVVFRGFLLRQFRILTHNLVAAVLLQAVLFSLFHGGNQSLTQYLKHGFSGCVFAYLAIRRKSLWPAILAHVLLDTLAFTAQFLRG